MTEQKRTALINALLTTPSVKAAAESLKVSERSVRRALDDPDFQRDLRKHCRQLVRGTVARLQQHSAMAGLTLAKLLHSENEAIQFGAARTILQLAVKGVETQDLEARIEELERVAQEAQRARSAYATFGQN
jgi:hypothetical protein